MGVCDAAFGVSLVVTASIADLGGSSKNPIENLEDHRGAGFRVNSIWTRVRLS